MADVEDGAEFGSHFLDSLLEVEMREEEGEVDISNNEDSSPSQAQDLLPPVPKFDLQNQTVTYKGPVVQAGLRNPPLVTSVVPNILPVVSSVPIVNSKSVITLHSKNLLPSMSTVVTPSANPNAAVSRANIKPPIKVVKNISASQQMKFLRQVFKPEFIKNVFTKKDSHSDISESGPEEMNFYKTCFKEVSNVRFCRIHCTICDKHLGCSPSAEKKLMVHKMLKVLTCKPCSEFYGDGNFPCDTGDNCEIYCRWCGQGGALVCCSFCPRVFCKKCVRRNFGPSFLRSIQRALEWACFCCAQKPLWPHRAICRALLEYIKLRKTDPKASPKDTTTCCVSILNKKKMKSVEKNKILLPGGQVKITPIPKIPIPPLEFKNKIVVPVKTLTGNEQSLLKSNLKLKLDDQNKPCLGPIQILAKTPPSVISSAPLRGPLPVPTGFISNLTIAAPHLIQRPVIRGETLITPPASRRLPASIPQHPEPPQPSPVRVSLANGAPGVHPKDIPTAKIPTGPQDLLLKIAFPDKKLQFVRLISEDLKGDPPGGRDRIVPTFNRKAKPTFLDRHMLDSFQLSKRIYDNLTLIKETLPTRTERRAMAASVGKLHLLYENSVELLKDLDKNLLEGFEEWKKGNPEGGQEPLPKGNQSEPVDPSKTSEKCKRVLEPGGRNSDVEILQQSTGKESKTPKAPKPVTRKSRKKNGEKGKERRGR